MRMTGPGFGLRHFGSDLAPGLWARLLLLLLVVGVYLATVIVNDMRERTFVFEDIRRLSDATTVSARTHTEAIFSTAIGLLRALRSDLGKGDDSLETVQSLLRDHFFDAPYLRTILVLDADGRIEASSIPRFIGNDASPLPLFRVHLDPERSAPFTGNIIVGNVTGAPHFFSSLRLEDEAGAFAGVIAVAYELTHLRDLYRRLIPGTAYTIGLFHAGEGLIVASDSEIRTGELPSSSRFPANVPSDGSGHMGAVKLLLEDGGDVFMTTQDVDTGPFFVSTMADIDALMAQYRGDRPVKFTLAAIFVCMAVALAGALEVYMYQRRRAEADKLALEANLRHAQKMEALGTLAGGLAHDFNNFLSSIIGFGEIARERAGDKPQISRAIDQILVAGRRAEAMVNQILTFSRRTSPAREPVRLGDIVTEVVELMQSSIRPSLTISLDMRGEDLWTKGAASQLDQVLMNLCSNAIQAMPDGGTLGIALDAVDIGEAPGAPAGLVPGRHARIVISDTGTGIPPEIRERIFDPFFTTKDIGRGTGLGLSIAHGIIAAHDGVIEIESSPGSGTRAIVFLPLCTPETRNPGDKAPCPTEGAGRRVLVLDDEEQILALLEDRLACLGFEPVGCNSASEALQAFEAAPGEFDLVISDLVMPEINGVDFLETVRARRPDIPVILMTGFATDDVRERAHLRGIETILGKPLSAGKLAGAVAAALGASATGQVADQGR